MWSSVKLRLHFISVRINLSSNVFFFLLGKGTISNDGATILKLLDVVHPAAKTLVDIARSQDAEVSSVCVEECENCDIL